MAKITIDYAHVHTYMPLLCGSCRYFDAKHAEREHERGMLIAKCKKIHEKVARTDWCHRPGEKLAHEKAMAEYRGKQNGTD